MPRHQRMPATIVAALALSMLAVLGPPVSLPQASAPVSAQDVPRLTGPVTDLTGELAGERSLIDSALERLERGEGIQLFVLWVESTDPDPVTDFTSEVARVNSLGGNDALLVVAVADRTDALWVSDGLDEVTDQEIDRILAGEVEPELADGAYGEAIAAAASGLGEASAGQFRPPSEPDGGAAPETGSVSFVLALLLILAGVGVAGYGLLSWFRRRQAARASAEERDARTGALAREANALLIQTDDAIRDAEQELAFAEAQFDAPDVAALRGRLEAARAGVKAAFAIRQKLDDAVPEDPVAREAMLAEIVQRCEAAKEGLAELRAALQQLWDLERTAPAVLGKQPAEIAALEGRLAEGRSQLEDLQRYAEGIWTSVRGNLAEAEKRIASAREQAGAGAAALQAGDHSAAVRAARRAQQALAEATALVAAIGSLAGSVAEAESRLEPQLVEAGQSVEAARQALASLPTETERSRRLADAQTALDSAHEAAAAPRPDPLSAYRLASEANALADELLANTREEQERRERERGAAEAALVAAEATLRQAADYIASRRHVIGRTARTRLAEAERRLDAARVLLQTDAAGATSEARRAQALAQEAYALARSEFGQADPFGRPRGPGVGDVMSILIPVILSGGRGAGWGGSPWGASGRGPFGSPGGGGGGGRVFGGGFGRAGPGGRVRGGRWG